MKHPVADLSMLRNILANSILQDTAKLVLGTAGGRLILLLAMPAVTRLYAPEDFRLLAVFVALVSTASVVACLRLEIAIPLAQNDEDAANLLALALCSTAVLSIVLLTLSCIAPQAFADWLGVPEIAKYLWLVALGTFLMSSYSALQFWATRMRQFGIIARTRVGQATTGVVTMLGLGWVGLTPLGLLLGNMLTLGAGGISLSVQTLRNDRKHIRVINGPRMKQTLRQYLHFPIFSTPEALANVAGVQVPILLIAAMAKTEAGQLFLAMQLMAIPMGLVGASVGQIYSSRAQEALRDGTLHLFTVSIMRRLFLVGVGPIALTALLAPAVFPLAFGAEWSRAGVIVAWIAPWMLIQLMVSPVSMGLHVTGQIRVALLLQIFGLFLRAGAVGLAVQVPSLDAVASYAVSGVVFYTVYGITIVYKVRKK